MTDLLAQDCEPAARVGDWIQTATGRQFWPLDPRAEDVCIEDIAHALAMKCRFGGHSRRFYSVAEHSVIVSHFVPPELALWGLLHDAAEAYLPDVPRPVKPHLLGFRDLENQVMAAVCERFSLDPIEPAEVKRVDTAALADEKAVLLLKDKGQRLTEAPAGARIWCFTPENAKSVFQKRFYELTEGASSHTAHLFVSAQQGGQQNG